MLREEGEEGRKGGREQRMIEGSWRILRGRGRRGEQECVRTVCLLSLSLTHGDSKSLAAPKCNISPNVSGRFQHC